MSRPRVLPPGPSPARVCHVHIPKAAGMSLYRALERWATPARSVRYARGGAEDLARFRQLTAADIAPLRLVAGHIGYPTFRARLGPEWIYITVLRDPVARMVSRFSYISSTPSHPWFGKVAGMDMGAFLAWYREQPSAVDQQCMLICGKPDADLAIDSAMHQLTLTVAIENLPVLVERLSALIDQPLDVGRQNVSTETVRRDELDSQTLRAIEDFNGADRLLYERVRDMVLVGTGAPSAVRQPAQAVDPGPAYP